MDTDGQAVDELSQWFDENEGWKPFADLVVRPPAAEELMEWWPGDVSPEVLARCMEMVGECGIHISRGTIYCRVRREYDPDEHRPSDHWAAMLALQSPPGIQTTDTFWAGRKPWYDVFGDSNSKKNNTYVNDIKRQLAKRGVRLKPGDEYMPELARFRGDPEAVIPFGGARSYIKNLCEKRGWACEGAVNVQGRGPEKDLLADENCIPMAEDLVRQNAAKMVKNNQDVFKGKNRREIREIVLEKHGPSKNKASSTLVPK